MGYVCVIKLKYMRQVTIDESPFQDTAMANSNQQL